MIRRKYGITGSEIDPVRDEVHRLRGVSWEYEALRITAEQTGERGLEIIPCDPRRMRLSYPSRVFSDGIYDNPGRRSERPVVEVHPAFRDQELPANDRPERFIVRSPTRLEISRQCIDRRRPRQRGAAQDGQKPTSIDRHGSRFRISLPSSPR